MIKLLILLCLTVAANLTCVPENGRTGIGYLTVCNKTSNCFTILSYKQTCINIPKGPYYSGRTRSIEYNCIGYHSRGCLGQEFIIGVSKIEFSAGIMSFRCPYSCQ